MPAFNGIVHSVRQPLGPTLVAARKQPALAQRAGLAAGQAPRLRHPPLSDQRHGGIHLHLQIALDLLVARRRAGTAAPSAQSLPVKGQ